ncbi:hypothetical protein ACFERN_000803 [Salmonella enterica]
MQPTKKRAIAKCVITAAAIGIGCAAVSEATAYMLSPRTMSGQQVDTSVAANVTSGLMTPTVDWIPANPTTTTRPVTLGTLKITATGVAGAPEAYLVGPCNGAGDYTLTVNDVETGQDFVVTLNNDAPIHASDRSTILDASADMNHSATVEVKVNKAPAAGMYRTCIGVTALADDALEFNPG